MITLVFLSALVVMAVCIILVFHKQYEDGLIGRIALGFIAVCAFARIAGLLEGGIEAYVSAVGAVLWIALAAFFGRHLYRFMRWRLNGENEWRPTSRVETAGKMR